MGALGRFGVLLRRNSRNIVKHVKYAFVAALRASWEGLGASWGSGIALGASWRPPGASWDVFGASWVSCGRLGDVWAYVLRSFRTSIANNLRIISKLVSISDRSDGSIGFHADSDVFSQGEI